jgi:hypothetical protein
VLGVPDPSRLPAADQRQESSLPRLERQAIDALAVEAEQVEREVDQARAWRAAPRGPLHRFEVRPPVGLQHDELAVDDGAAHGELSGGVNDLGEPARPVLTVAADEPDPAAVDQAADAVPIQLDFVQPLIA